jgi:protein phosphatase
MLIDSGELRPEEVVSHPARGRLTRFIGMTGEPLPEARSVELQTGDKLLLCSDGLTGMLRDSELYRLLRERRSPRTTCQKLLAAALNAGGKDNISTIVISFNSSD